VQVGSYVERHWTCGTNLSPPQDAARRGIPRRSMSTFMMASKQYVNQLLADTAKSGFGNLANGPSTAALLQPHQLANFLETEAQILRTLNEPNPVDRSDRIAAHTAAVMWDSQQTAALVVPYSFDPHLGRPSEPPMVTAASSERNGTVAGTRLAAVLGMT
jgi:hypothetical protein